MLKYLLNFGVRTHLAEVSSDTFPIYSNSNVEVPLCSCPRSCLFSCVITNWYARDCWESMLLCLDENVLFLRSSLLHFAISSWIRTHLGSKKTNKNATAWVSCITTKHCTLHDIVGLLWYFGNVINIVTLGSFHWNFGLTTAPLFIHVHFSWSFLVFVYCWPLWLWQRWNISISDSAGWFYVLDSFAFIAQIYISAKKGVSKTYFKCHCHFFLEGKGWQN